MGLSSHHRGFEMKRIKEIEERVKEMQSIELEQVYGKPHVYSDCEYLLEKLKSAVEVIELLGIKSPKDRMEYCMQRHLINRKDEGWNTDDGWRIYVAREFLKAVQDE